MGETLSGEIFVGRNFRYQTKNSSLSPDEKFRPIKVNVSIVKAQVSPRGKQVNWTKLGLSCWAKFLSGKIIRRVNFCHFSKN